MRKYLLRLERQGKALTPQQQAVLDKINTPKKVDSDSDSDSDSEESFSNSEESFSNLEVPAEWRRYAGHQLLQYSPYRA